MIFCNDACSEQPKPVATVFGEPFTDMPKDLYIPPNALEVILEAFSGPLDLLLYLIKKENIDILDIPIAKVTEQYMEYVDLMKQVHLELAAEYLVMAAMLAEIKSRMLLPRPAAANGEEEDPRAELVRRLREYERFKKAAEDLDVLPRVDRDLFLISADVPEIKHERKLPQIQLQELVVVFQDVLQRSSMYAHHLVKHSALSVRERMSQILQKMQSEQFISFINLFDLKEGRQGVVVTFIAILELIRQSIIDMVQTEPFAPIYLKTMNLEP
jgi:segregation and condensation protein A